MEITNLLIFQKFSRIPHILGDVIARNNGFPFSSQRQPHIMNIKFQRIKQSRRQCIFSGKYACLKPVRKSYSWALRYDRHDSGFLKKLWVKMPEVEDGT
jgi:hypothetical protein